MKNIFIYNLESGNKNLKKIIPLIIEKLKENFENLECIKTTHAGHAFEIASTTEGYDHLFVAGGDGTLNEIINAIGDFENKPTLGIIPTGTVNDVARSLGIPLNLKKALNVLLNGTIVEHDIFKTNKKYGIYVCCAGLFSKTSYQAERKKKKLFGRLAYLFKGISEIFKSKPINITLKTENETINEDCSLILILNSKSIAGFKLNKTALLDDGEVEVAIFKCPKDHIRFIDIIRIVNTFLFGLNRIKNKKYVVYRKLSNFTLKTKDEVPINMDGEKTTKGSFNFSIINKGIKIITKK